MDRPPDDLERELADTGWLRRLARSVVRDDATADDVVQETAVAALRGGPSRPGAVRGWLAAVARNAARRMRRDEHRRETREAAVARPEASADAEETADRLEAARALLAAVDALEEPYRTAIRLRWLDGLAPREVAVRLGVSPEVAWKRLSRGLAMLRARLDRDRGGRRAWVFLVADLGGVRTEELPLAPVAAGAIAAAVSWKAAAAAVILAACGAAVFAALGGAASGTSAVDDAVRTAVAPSSEGTAGVPGTSAAERRGLRVRARGATSGDARPASADAADPLRATGSAPTVDPPADRIIGRVVDPDGRPVEGAFVSLAAPGRGAKGSVQTTVDGAFVLPQPGDGTAKGELCVVSADWAYTLVGVQRLVAGEVDAGDVRVGRRTPVAGRIVTTEGTPVEGAQLFLASPHASGQFRLSAVAARDGSFRFDAAGPATWLLIAAPRPKDGGDALWRTVVRQVQGGERDVQVVVRVREPGRARVVLEVVDPDGRPVELDTDPSSVRVYSAASFDDGGNHAGMYITRYEGALSSRASIECLRPGDWLVWVKARKCGPVLTPLRVEAWDTDLRLRIVATEPGRLRATVEFLGGPSPRTYAVIAAGSLGPPYGQRLGTPDLYAGGRLARQEDGSHATHLIAPGAYRLHLLAPGWYAEVVAVDVVAAATTEARLVARSGGGVRWLPSIPADCEGEISFAEGDGEFETLLETGGGTFTVPLVLPAFPLGRLRWRLRTAPRDTLAAEGRVVTTREGEVTIVEGETVEILDSPADSERAPR